LISLIKIDKDFHPFKQAELDMLIYEYLDSLANDIGCKIYDLPKHYNLGELRRLINIFSNEVQLIWRENKEK